MTDTGSGFLQWTIILVFTALVLATVVLAQTVASYSSAYVAAPKEVAAYIDTVDFSIQENESYDRDVAKVQRLEDKIRLGRLLREIQRCGDDLREELDGLVMDQGTTTLRTSSRLLWAYLRPSLDDRVRRLDLLRMRFLVVYMGIITSIADRQPPPPPPLPRGDPEKTAFSPTGHAHNHHQAAAAAAHHRTLPVTPSKPPLSRSATIAEDHAKRPPLRRLTTHAIGHNENTGRPHRKGWAGVVEELQTSPKMHKRHASIEQAMALDKTPPSA
ncbi:hypothetical protein GMORB2_5970 [Geosmithia morbida]|uniref:Uncharacterized protein n=1 Tax=Geosmithia morbida TaxID=1094350 RepID=A0A9P4YYS3_9HYPO|nr:uncharacterized protein GMORB2_5970 [Geosmithia morbida]KAF4124254.1 hypothetical protein GMORB2_5970 [Geosmithia morbida]